MKNKTTPNYLKPIFIIFAILIIILFIFYTYFLINSPKNTSNKNNLINELNQQNELISKNLISYFKDDIITEPQMNEHSPILGDENAPITIFEFSSFGCSYSSKIQPIIKQILKEYSGQVKLIWKDLPMEEVYPGIIQSHIAGRCAGEQGKFWQYHNQLWESQDDLNLNAIAKNINLDINQFNSCLKNEDVKKIIEADINEADQLLISGTPHFYINQQELLGDVTLENFEQIIEIELNRLNLN